MSSIAQKIDRSQEIDEIYKNAKIRNFDDYMALPEINRHYEIIDGEIIMSPTPNADHQWLVLSLAYPIREHVLGNKLGHVFVAPFDVKISESPFHTRQPDFLFISTKRSGLAPTRRALSGIQLLEIAPELVIEILSPSDTPKVISEKLVDYQKIGVDECWLVDSDTETVKALRLSSDSVERIGIFGTGDKVQSEVLTELNLSVDEIFA